MDVHRFYNRLFAPVIAEFGPFDSETIAGIIGFDGGGPVTMMTIGRSRREQIVTYVTCELAVRNDQVASDVGTHELLVRCDDEVWARKILTKAGQMSIDVGFGHGHTLDIGPWVGEEAAIQGLAFELYSHCRIDQHEHGVLRVHGLTRGELVNAQEKGVDAVLALRRTRGESV